MKEAKLFLLGLTLIFSLQSYAESTLQKSFDAFYAHHQVLKMSREDQKVFITKFFLDFPVPEEFKDSEFHQDVLKKIQPILDMEMLYFDAQAGRLQNSEGENSAELMESVRKIREAFLERFE